MEFTSNVKPAQPAQEIDGAQGPTSDWTLTGQRFYRVQHGLKRQPGLKLTFDFDEMFSCLTFAVAFKTNVALFDEEGSVRDNVTLNY